MDFNELTTSFAERHGVADFVAENGVAALDIDGIVITIVADGDALSLSAEVGQPPAECRADFADLLLEANMQPDAVFAKAPDSGNYVLVRRLSLPALDDGAFDAALEALVNLTETWRRLLADFRPAAAAAADKNNEAPAVLFGLSGIMKV